MDPFAEDYIDPPELSPFDAAYIEPVEPDRRTHAMRAFQLAFDNLINREHDSLRFVPKPANNLRYIVVEQGSIYDATLRRIHKAGNGVTEFTIEVIRQIFPRLAHSPQESKTLRQSGALRVDFYAGYSENTDARKKRSIKKRHSHNKKLSMRRKSRRNRLKI